MKNFIIIASVIIIAVVTIVGWNNSKAPSIGNAAVNKPIVPTTQEGCLSVDGTWAQVGLIREKRCSLPTGDSGKKCTDSNQCQGACLSHDAGVSGECSPTTLISGCVTLMNHGRPSQICYD